LKTLESDSIFKKNIRYISYKNIKDIITKILNENVTGEFILKSLIFESYEESYLETVNKESSMNQLNLENQSYDYSNYQKDNIYTHKYIYNK